MFDKTSHQMNNWRRDKPQFFGDQVDHSTLPAPNWGMVTQTWVRYSWYCSDNPRAKIDMPRCSQYMPANFLAIRPLNCDEINTQDDDDENWADHGPPSGRRCRTGDCHDNDDGEGEEDTHSGGGNGTAKGTGSQDGKGTGKATVDGKGNGKWKGKTMEAGKGKGKGNTKGKCIVERTPEGDDISRAIALQLRKEMYEADVDTEGELQGVYLDPEASPAMSISSDDDSDSTEELVGEYDSEHDFDVDMCIEDNVDAPYGGDSDGEVDLECDSDDEEVDDEDEEDDEDKDGEEEDEDQEEDEDENDGNEPRTIGQGEMLNPLANDVDSMVDDQPLMLPEQCQEIRERTTRRQPAAPAPQPYTPEPRPWPPTQETHPSGGLEFFGAFDSAKTSPGGANRARSWGSRHHLGCGCGSAVAVGIGRWRKSHQCHCPQCCSPWCTPGLLSGQRVNQSSRCRGGDDNWVVVWVRFLSCSFP